MPTPKGIDGVATSSLSIRLYPERTCQWRQSWQRSGKMESLWDLASPNLPNLVSMIGMFIQERRHQKGLTHQEFLEWLDNHRFEELKRIILNTHGIEREIDIMLKAQQSEILGELSVISQTVSKIASRMEIFGGVSQMMTPRVQLSEQALWMLRRLDQAKEYYPFIHIFNYDGGMRVTIGGSIYKVDHPRFIREDFADLSSVGFISIHKHNSDGEPVFGITRLGAEYVKTLPELPPDETPSVQIG